MSQQTSKLIENELCHDKRQLSFFTTENGKNLTIQLRQKTFMLRQGFSTGCQHQEEFVATKKLLSRQMKQAGNINIVTTR